MGSRTSEIGRSAFESKIDESESSSPIQIYYHPATQPHHTPSSPSSPSNGVANGFSWTSQAFQLTFHLGNLSFRATHTKHTWKDGAHGGWHVEVSESWGLVFFVWGADIILGLEILFVGYISYSKVAVGELGLPRCVANGWCHAFRICQELVRREVGG